MSKDNMNPNSIEQGTKNIAKYNLKNRSEEDRKRIASMGFRAMEKKKKELKHAKDILTDLLASDIATEDKQRILRDNNSKAKTYYDVLMEKAYKIATEEDGNIKAIQFVTDYVGDKPTDTVKIDANVITDNDRQLLKILTDKVESDI